MNPYILRVFLNADLRASHRGLTEFAKTKKLDLPNLEKNQFVVFINRSRTMMKCFVHGNTIAFTKRDRIELSVISRLPQAFGYSGELKYDNALREYLEKKLGTKRNSEALDAKIRKHKRVGGGAIESAGGDTTRG